MPGLANVGNGFDVTFKIGNAVTTQTYANTATSQYKVAFMQQSNTTEDYSADYRVTNTMIPIGIIQSVQDTNSTEMTVRVSGITKAYAADSILAGTYVIAADHTCGDAECGYVTYHSPNQSFTGTSVPAQRIIGLALQQAQKTGAAISILLTPGIGY